MVETTIPHTMAPASQEEAQPYCIVTGANSGIGKEIARGLMARGCHVILACRNMETCDQARASLVADGSSGSCACARVDLEDFQSVRAFASAQRQALGRRRLGILVNNAGVMNVPDRPGGEDRHMRANHYGPFLLTRLLEPALGQGSRVVNVASRAHFSGTLHFDGAGNVDQHPKWWFSKYARSKLANVSFTAELQRRLRPRGIAAYATSPGPVNTSLFRDFPWYSQWLLRPLAQVCFRTPQQGAQSSVFAATSPELKEGDGVLFIHDNKAMLASRQAQDAGIAQKLWEASDRIVEFGKYPEDRASK